MQIRLMAFALRSIVLTSLVLWPRLALPDQPSPAKRYYGHEAVEDGHGVIAPWYRGQNGQCDFRIRVAAETIKRYPWAVADQTVAPAPHFVFNSHWQIAR